MKKQDTRKPLTISNTSKRLRDEANSRADELELSLSGYIRALIKHDLKNKVL
jgi:hypothetical protein